MFIEWTKTSSLSTTNPKIRVLHTRMYRKRTDGCLDYIKKNRGV